MSLTLRLSDWVGDVQPVKVQLKPVGRETDANTPIYEWTFSVSGTDTAVQLTNLPAGVYTVRAFPASPGRWLCTEGKLLTEVPWLFAVPTGANKVTVYWDGVPGATGYRVRWGATSGSYPNSSAVLPATARQHTVLGLVSEREYYFVVEAEYNGLWGPPSEEDSAIPHEGAIPWDTGDAGAIVSQIRELTNSPADYGLIDCIGPDGLIYSEYGVRLPDTFFDEERGSLIVHPQGFEIPLTRHSEELESACTGPYRRVKSRAGFTGARGKFWVSSTWSPRYPYLQILITERATQTGALDTPCVYFGFAAAGVDVEGGLMYHPAGRPQNVNYARWQAYLKVVEPGRKREEWVALQDSMNERGHILDSLSGGNEVEIELTIHPKSKLVALTVIPVDPYWGKTIFRRTITGHAKVREGMSGSFRRVHSIAQRREAVSCLLGYRSTGSFIRGMGIGYNPVEGQLLDSPAELALGVGPPYLRSWYEWRPEHTVQQGSFPPPSSGIVSWNSIVPYSREVISITLP